MTVNEIVRGVTKSLDEAVLRLWLGYVFVMHVVGQSYARPGCSPHL